MKPLKFINTLNETESEMARREYIIRNVLLFLFIVTFSFTLISFILYLSGKMPLDTLIIYLIISIMLFVAMFLTAKGYWRVAGIIPPLLMYLTAVNGNYIGGIDAPANFMYVLMIIFIAIIYGYKKMWIALGICLPTYLCLAWMISSGYIKPFRTAEVVFINRVVITSGFIIIISLMIWILGRSYRKEIDIRIKAEENLRVREESYRIIFENTGTSMILIEEDTSISMANDEFARKTGYSPDEIIGRMKWTELVHPDEISRMVEQHRLRREIDGEALQSYELRYMTKTGDTRDALLNIQLVPGTKKSIASLIDISDRKRADEALRESEAKHRLLFENAGEGILIAQGDMIKLANPALADMLGYPSDIITTRPFSSFIHSDDRAIVVDRHMRRMRGEPMETGYDFRIITADGTQRRLHIISQIISWEGIASSLSFVIDITDHRRVEEELREAEEIYRNIFMNSQIGLFRTDIQTGMLLEANDSMAKFSSFKNREELLSDNRSIAERYVDPEARQKMIASIIEHGQIDRFETQFRRYDGSVIWIRLSAKLIAAKGWLEGVAEDITEEKNAREALRRSEERYRTLVENASDIIFRTDNTGHFTFVNPAALRTTGYEKEVIIGMHYPELIRQDMRDEAIKFFGRQFVKGLNNTYSEYPIITKDGHELWLGQNTQLIAEDGNVTGFQSVARDITERKRVEDALRESEERYRSILEEMEEAYYEVDLKGNFTFFNESLCKTFGYSRVELMGMNNRAYTSPKHARKAFLAFNEIYQTGIKKALIDYEIIKKDGGKRSLETSILPVKNPSGEIIGFRGVLRDITDRKQADEALLDSKLKFQFLAENMADVVFTLDINLATTYVSPSIERMLGFTPEERIAQKVDQQLTPKSQKLVFETLLEELGRDKEKGVDLDRSMNMELEYYHKNGSIRYLATYIRGIRDSEGNLTGFYGSHHDITDRKKMEDDLKVSEINLRMILDSVDNAIFIYTKDGKIIDVNSKMLEMYRVSREEVCSMSIEEDFSTPDNPLNELPGIWESVMKEKERVFEWQARRPHDGSTFNAEVFLRKINLSNGEFILAAVRDITDRKKSDEKLQNTMESLRKAVGTTIQVMVSAIESRDPYTAGHQVRSANLARTIATEMGLSQDKVEGIRMAGSIHDIGKLSIPAEILSKPSKLSELEFSLIKEHARQGYEMLKNVESPWPLAEIVYQHHERMDGSGYPRKLKGNDILIEARILNVADVVEAIASHRPYRPALGLDAALEEIEKNRGTLYDEAVVDICIRLFREKSFKFEDN